MSTAKKNSAPSHERREAVDEKIYAATLELLASQGAVNLRISDVAKQAGVDKTSVYRRHKKIESIILAAVSNFAEKEIPMPNTGSLLDDFKALTRSVCTLLESTQGRALMQATGSAALVELRQSYWKDRLARAAVLIERATQRNECSQVNAPQSWIESLVAPIHFRVFQTQGKANLDFLDAQAQRVFEEMMNRYPAS